MPLIVLGLIVLICILIYAISDFIKDNKKEAKAPKITAKIKVSEENPESDEDKALLFPTDNVETEKKKRNIH